MKNTFIDVVDATSFPEEGFVRLRGRASSDPTLFETCQQEEARRRSGEDFHESHCEFEMHGMSDSEANTEDEGPALVAELPCYHHIEEEGPAVPAADLSCAEEDAPRSPTSEDAWTSPAASGEPEEPEEASWQKPQNIEELEEASQPPISQIEHLLSENARLALENRMLRSRMQHMGEPATTAGHVGQSSSGAATSGAEQAMSGPTQAMATGVEALWGGAIVMPVTMGFIVPSQAVQYTRSSAQKVEAAEPLPSRRQRRRSSAQRAAAVAAAVAESRAVESGSGAGMASVVAEAASSVAPEKRTTVMLRNLPNNYNRAMVLAMLDSEGFEGKYDFLYLPIDFKSCACLGYAFINLVDPGDVLRFWRKFDGYSRWILPSKKVCHVSWSGPHQGLHEHVERYRNSPVMHQSVPDEYKPVVFRDGLRMVFPPPTKTPRAPRIRHMTDFRASGGQALAPAASYQLWEQDL